jgi:hypothetical protein
MRQQTPRPVVEQLLTEEAERLKHGCIVGAKAVAEQLFLLAQDQTNEEMAQAYVEAKVGINILTAQMCAAIGATPDQAKAIWADVEKALIDRWLALWNGVPGGSA